MTGLSGLSGLSGEIAGSSTPVPPSSTGIFGQIFNAIFNNIFGGTR